MLDPGLNSLWEGAHAQPILDGPACLPSSAGGLPYVMEARRVDNRCVGSRHGGLPLASAGGRGDGFPEDSIWLDMNVRQDGTVALHKCSEVGKHDVRSDRGLTATGARGL